jgi:hypothetical protein
MAEATNLGDRPGMRRPQRVRGAVDQRLVVRRETRAELLARDVDPLLTPA